MAPNESSCDFVVHLQGGEGCAHNQTLCKELLEDKPQLFTSEGFPETVAAHSFLSANESENALYSTYNRVYVPYCTMDMYLLDTESPAGGGDMQFRGRPLLEEAFRTILEPSKNDTSVVFGGSSAGGVGAFNAVEWLLDTFNQVTELSVILDSALFSDVHGYLKPLLYYIQEDPSVAYGSHCAEEFDGGPCCVQFGCMLQRGYYPTAEKKLRGTFVVSSSQDFIPAIKIDQLGMFEESNPEMMWSAAVYTGQMRSSLRNLASVYPSALSVFSPSCIDHVLIVSSEVDMAPCVPGLEAATDSGCENTCRYGDSGHAIGRVCDGTFDAGVRWQGSQSVDSWNTLQINGTSVREAMEQWWEGRGDASKQVRLFDSCDDPHCNPSCQGSILPGKRGATDSLFSWVLVLVTLAFAIAILGAGVSAVVWSCLQWNRVQVIVARRLASKGMGAADVRNEKHTTSAAESSGLRLERETTGDDGDDGVTTPVLEWRGLSYWLPRKTGWSSSGALTRHLPSWRSSNDVVVSRREKKLLFSVDGAVPAGALCALMGPSGSGKSTLLDLLTGRRTVGRCRGDILFKGKSIADQQEIYIRNAGYMRQSNMGYLAGLSVFDNLVYAAIIRLQGTLEAKLDRVQTVMEETALVRVQSTKASSLSGGQKRRLMLALELLGDRHLLFLDEPTSGVDATAALELVTILSRLSTKVTIVVAIHQPRPEVWELFSHTILVKSGRVVYCGPAVDALDGISRYLPRTKTAALRFADRQDAQGHTASLSQSTLGGVGGGVFGAGVVSTPCADNMAVDSGPLDLNVVGFQEDNADYSSQGDLRNLRKRSALGSTSSKALGWFRWRRWNAGPSIMKNGDGGRRGLSMKVGSKLQVSDNAEEGVEAEVGTANGGSGKTVPDKILDMLVRIDRHDLDNARAQEVDLNGGDIGPGHSGPVVQGETKHQDVDGELEGKDGTEVVDSFQTPTTSSRLELNANASNGRGIDTPQDSSRSASASSGAPDKKNEEDEGWGKPRRGTEERLDWTSVWKLAATLLARSGKSGYGMQMLWNFGILAGAITLVAVAFRQATRDSEMLHLVVSVLFSMVLPVILTYHPLMIENTWKEWSLTKTEIADGFYPPVCATTRMVLDHLAVGVVGSFSVVGIMYSILWHRFISDLPASALGVNIQLSCGVTLIAWLMISLFDALAISGLQLTMAFSIGVSVTSVWVFFSGTVLIMSSIPNALRALTYTSPHYWNSSFMLRVILDGLDMTDTCEHNNPFYCATGYGDLVAGALSLHMRPNGYNLLAVVLFALVSFAVLVTMMEMKGRHKGVLGGLGRPAPALLEAGRTATEIGLMKVPKGSAVTAARAPPPR